MSVQEKQNLTEKQLSILSSEMEKHKKSTGLTYALLIFFGTLGIHKFYIGKAKWGIIYLVLGILGWMAILTGASFATVDDVTSAGGFGIFGLLCLLAVGIFLLIDLFTIPAQLRKIYDKSEEKIVKNLISSNSVNPS